MRLGLHLPQFRAGAAVAGTELAEAATAAEDAGADDLWVSDHLLVDPPRWAGVDAFAREAAALRAACAGA